MLKIEVFVWLTVNCAFQIELPVCGGKFSYNISIPKVRVNKMETETDSSFETS